MSRPILLWFSLIGLASCGESPTGGIRTPILDAGTTDAAGDAGVRSDAGAAFDAGSSIPIGQAPMWSNEYGAFVSVSLAGSGPFLMRYDSGSPFSFIHPDVASEIGARGSVRIDADVGELTLSARHFEVAAGFENDVPYPGLPATVDGLLGNDFFEGHSVGLHFRGAEMWVAASRPADMEPPHPTGVAERVVAPMQQPLGYLLVDCAFQDGPADQECLFDTGPYDSVVFDRYFRDLPHPTERRVPQYAADAEGTPLFGFHTWPESTRIGDLVTREWTVVVMESFALLDIVGAAIGVELEGLIGFSTSLDSYTVIDYDNDRILFYRYDDRDHLPGLERFEGFGFVVGSAPDGLRLAVAAVIEGTDVDRAGVLAGDVLTAIDGMPPTDIELTSIGLIVGEPGSPRTFTFLRGDEAFDVVLMAELQLPRPPGR